MLSTKTSLMKAQNKKLSQREAGRISRWVNEHLALLTWLVPAAMVLLVVGYEFGPARWIYLTFGFRYHLVIEILLFGTLGPALAFVMLQLLGRWLEERDTSELQAQLLARTRAEAEGSRQLNDDALQVLFAAGMLIDTLKAGNEELPPEMRSQVEETERSLQDAVGQLRNHLLKRQA